MGVYVQLAYQIRYLGVRNTLQQSFNKHSEWKINIQKPLLGIMSSKEKFQNIRVNDFIHSV